METFVTRSRRTDMRGLTLADHPVFQIVLFLTASAAVGRHSASRTLEYCMLVTAFVVTDMSAVH